MKNEINSIIAVLLVFLIIAFIKWEINPAQWEWIVRALAVLASIPAAIFGYMFNEFKESMK